MNREEIRDLIARSVHESIRAYQLALGEPPIPPWDEAESMQESTREAVEFALRNPSPGAQHDHWVRSKQRDGWTYGPAKDATKKTHPSMVPFDELSETERRKDAILIGVVQALARALGMLE
jgi:hypothetical protein